nr:DoxX family membrane protein [Streptomyces griseicoloratus]
MGLLLLSLVPGLALAAHGAQKLFGWFGGGGIEGTGQFLAMSGCPSGEAMAVIAGLTETLGGPHRLVYGVAAVVLAGLVLLIRN